MPGPWRLVSWLSLLGHGHMATASLRLTVEQGLITGTTFDLRTAVPQGYGTRWEREQPFDHDYVPYSSGEYTLIGRAKSGSEVPGLCCYWPKPVPHPDYVLMKPSGCEGCLAIWANFLPQTSPANKVRLTSFNFGCITRWSPCADEEDIMPEAGTEFYRENRARMLADKAADDCTDSVEELSRASLDAAVVHVEWISTAGSGDFRLVKLRLVKLLVGPGVWHRDETANVEFSSKRPEGRLLLDALAKQRSLIVLYPHGPLEHQLEPYTCGVLAYNDQTLKEVIAGISLGKGIPETE